MVVLEYHLIFLCDLCGFTLRALREILFPRALREIRLISEPFVKLGRREFREGMSRPDEMPPDV
jgi:hypothetical protein